MKHLVCCLGVLLAGCCPPPPLICPPPEPPSARVPAPAAAAASPPAVTIVVRHFDAATQLAIERVLEPDISSAQIETIRHAEARARRALTHLGRVLPRMNVTVMAEARNAVKALEDALK
jgi:hypothetical protein